MEGKQIFNAAEAARIVGCTPQEMRFNLEKGVWKFGRVIYPNATGKKLKKYIILRCDLKKYFGLEDDYIEACLNHQ